TQDELIAANALTPGTTYYVQVSGTGTFDPADCYTLTLTSSSTPCKLNGESSTVKNGFTAFATPNPASGKTTLHINTGKNAVAEITVLDLPGRIVQHENVEVSNGENEFPIDLENLPSGIYNVKVMIGTEQQTVKLAVSKN